jgi:hypothetical protein
MRILRREISISGSKAGDLALLYEEERDKHLDVTRSRTVVFLPLQTIFGSSTQNRRQ